MFGCLQIFDDRPDGPKSYAGGLHFSARRRAQEGMPWKESSVIYVSGPDKKKLARPERFELPTY